MPESDTKQYGFRATVLLYYIVQNGKRDFRGKDDSAMVKIADLE